MVQTVLEKIRKELETIKASVGKLTPEQEQSLKELDEHRNWRSKLDVEFDVEFNAGIT